MSFLSEPSLGVSRAGFGKCGMHGVTSRITPLSAVGLQFGLQPGHRHGAQEWRRGDRSVGFWKIKVVQKATELRGLLLFLWREVALLHDPDHLIEKLRLLLLAYSPPREGCTGFSAGTRSRHRLTPSTSPAISSGARASREGPEDQRASGVSKATTTPCVTQ